MQPSWWDYSKVVHIYYDTGGGHTGLLESVPCIDVTLHSTFVETPDKIIPWPSIYRIERVS